jgi:hypothetical protein
VSLANIWAGNTGSSPIVLPGFSVNYGTNPPTISYNITGSATTFTVPRNDDGSMNVGGAAVGATEYQLISLLIIRGNLAPVIIPNQTPLPDFTLFAPRDADLVSFLSVADETAARTAINSLTPADAAALAGYHLVRGRFVSTDFTDGQRVVMYSGVDLEVDINGSTITLIDKNAATDPTVISANNLTNAGVLHGINGVLRRN